jgi:hypothetical protein
MTSRGKILLLDVVDQLDKKFPVFYVTGRFTAARH